MNLNDLTLSKGLNYIFVNSNGTPSENAINVLTAYNKASISTPNGLTLGINNRIAIVLAPGKYEFLTPFTLINNYVDVISSTGQADVEINNLKISANDVMIKGIYTPEVLWVESNLTLLVAENCKCDKSMFVTNTEDNILSGTFINCIGGAIGYSMNCTGTFIGCRGTNYSFGGKSGDENNIVPGASGYFLNCKAGNYSFGGGTANGLWSPSAYNTASGTFINCIAGSQSFGGNNSASGIFINCKGDLGCFVFNGNSFTGKAYNCKAGNFSFGGHYGGNTGTIGIEALIFNCVAGAGSFGNTVLAGKVINSFIFNDGTDSLGAKYTFTAPTSGGKIANCVDGTYANINL